MSIFIQVASFFRFVSIIVTKKIVSIIEKHYLFFEENHLFFEDVIENHCNSVVTILNNGIGISILVRVIQLVVHIICNLIYS